MLNEKALRIRVSTFIDPAVAKSMKVYAARMEWRGLGECVERAWKAYELQFRGQNGSHPAVPAHQSEEAI